MSLGFALAMAGAAIGARIGWWAMGKIINAYDARNPPNGFGG